MLRHKYVEESTHNKRTRSKICREWNIIFTQTSVYCYDTGRRVALPRYEYTFGLSLGFQLFDPAFVRSKFSCESRVRVDLNDTYSFVFFFVFSQIF